MEAANSLENPSATNTVPSSDSEITAEWFQGVTGIPIIRPYTFRILPNPNEQVGNLSKMVRVGFQDEEDRLHTFMVKLLPVATDTDPTAPELRDIVTSENMNGREIFFYATLKGQLERLVPGLGPYFVPCFQSTQTPEGSLLILQDLTPQGFQMPSFSTGQSHRHFGQTLDFLAKFHVGGELLQRELSVGHKFLQTYPALKSWHVPRSGSSQSLFQQFKSLTWFPEGLKFVANHVMGNSPIMAQDYLALIPWAEKILRFIAVQGSKFPTVIHDDLWPHNFLCHGTREELKVIDWQLLGFADPSYDLATFLLSSLPIVDLSRVKLTGALQKYYELKAKFSNDQGLPLDRRTWVELESFFNSTGLGYGLVWFAMSADSIFANQDYRQKLTRIFEYLWEEGVPKFLIEKAHHQYF